MAAYLQACLEEAPDDPALMVAALGDIARARGMVQLAKETGLTREGLYTRRYRRTEIRVSVRYSRQVSAPSTRLRLHYLHAFRLLGNELASCA
jgi:hypothetical protein